MTQKQQDYSSKVNEFGDFDFRLFLNFINRNKKFIASFSFIITIISGIISLQKPVWEGSFEVYVKAPEKNFNSGILSMQNLLGNTSGFVHKNEQTILRSPSVLPVFDFIKKEKLKKGIKFETNNPKNGSKITLN